MWKLAGFPRPERFPRTIGSAIVNGRLVGPLAVAMWDRVPHVHETESHGEVFPWPTWCSPRSERPRTAVSHTTELPMFVSVTQICAGWVAASSRWPREYLFCQPEDAEGRPHPRQCTGA